MKVKNFIVIYTFVGFLFSNLFFLNAETLDYVSGNLIKGGNFENASSDTLWIYETKRWYEKASTSKCYFGYDGENRVMVIDVNKGMPYPEDKELQWGTFQQKFITPISVNNLKYFKWRQKMTWDTPNYYQIFFGVINYDMLHPCMINGLNQDEFGVTAILTDTMFWYPPYVSSFNYHLGIYSFIHQPFSTARDKWMEYKIEVDSILAYNGISGEVGEQVLFFFIAADGIYIKGEGYYGEKVLFDDLVIEGYGTIDMRIVDAFMEKKDSTLILKGRVHNNSRGSGMKKGEEGYWLDSLLVRYEVRDEKNKILATGETLFVDVPPKEVKHFEFNTGLSPKGSYNVYVYTGEMAGEVDNIEENDVYYFFYNGDTLLRSNVEIAPIQEKVIRIKVNSERTEEYSIRIMGIDGKVIKELRETSRDGYIYYTPFNLSSGNYFIEIKGRDVDVCKKIIYVK